MNKENKLVPFVWAVRDDRQDLLPVGYADTEEMAIYDPKTQISTNSSSRTTMGSTVRPKDSDTDNH